jgi:hypothetical protein
VEARTHLRHGGASRRRLTVWAIPGRKALAGTAACVLVAAVALMFAATTTGPQRSFPASVQPIARPIPAVAPSTVLAQQPYIGVACPAPVPFHAARAIAITLACNRVGLAITLRTRAVTAIATINGQPFKLDSAAWSDPPVGGKHKSLSGFLQPAAFPKRGPFKIITDRAGYRNRVTIERLHLVIDYGAGREVQTSLTELGYGGWG